MYLVIRRYGLPEAALKEVVEKTQKGFMSTLGQLPGFIDYYYVYSQGTAMTVSVFRDRASAERSVELAADWVRKNIPGLYAGPPEILSGDVLFDFHSEARKREAA